MIVIMNTVRQNILVLVVCVPVLMCIAELRAADAKPASPAPTITDLFNAFQVELQPEPPEWATVDHEPLFSFTWLTDVHLSPARLQFFKDTLKYIDDQLKPDLVMITGDNNYMAVPDDPADPQPLSLRRHRFLKTVLDDHLKTPYAIIPGDNWPLDFEKVFGPLQYSFNCGGMHFIFASADRACHGTEGLAVFDESTLAWLAGDLEKNRDRPTIFLMHEPVVPPTFLDAGRLERLLDKHMNVLAGFHGHLHVDMHVNSPVRPYLVCPALRQNPSGGLKHIKVYRHALILRTLEYNQASGRLEEVNKWQKIDVPPNLGVKLHNPEPGVPAIENHDAVPIHPHTNDPKLIERKQELLGPAMDFFRQQLPAILKHAAKQQPKAASK